MLIKGVPDKKTEIVDVIIVIQYIYVLWLKGWEGVRGDWRVRGGQFTPGKEPEWIGIRHHEQDIRLPSKWGFLFTLNARGYSQIIDYVFCKYKDGIFVCRLKIKHVWSTSSCI